MTYSVLSPLIPSTLARFPAFPRHLTIPSILVVSVFSPGVPTEHPASRRAVLAAQWDGVLPSFPSLAPLPQHHPGGSTPAGAEGSDTGLGEDTAGRR